MSRIKLTSIQEREARQRFWISRALWRRLGFFLDEQERRPGWLDVRTGARGELGCEGLTTFAEEKGEGDNHRDFGPSTVILDRLMQENLTVRFEVQTDGADVQVERPTRFVLRIIRTRAPLGAGKGGERRDSRLKYRVVPIGPPTRRFFNDEGGADNYDERRRTTISSQDESFGGQQNAGAAATAAAAAIRGGGGGEAGSEAGQTWSIPHITDGSWSGFAEYCIDGQEKDGEKDGQVEATVEMSVLFLASGTFRFFVAVDEVRQLPKEAREGDEEQLCAHISELVQVVVGDIED